MKDVSPRVRRNPNDVAPSRVRYVHLRRYDLDQKCYLPTGGVTLAYTHEADGMMRVGAAFCSLSDQYVKNTPKLPYTPAQFDAAVGNVECWCHTEWPRIQEHCAEYELGEPNERRSFMEWVRGFKYQVIRDLTMRIHTSNKPVHATLPICGRELALQRYDQSPCWLLPDPELGFSDWNNVVARLTTRWAAKWLTSANAAGIWMKWELRPLATKRCHKPLNNFTGKGTVLCGDYYGKGLYRTFVIDDIVDVEKMKIGVDVARGIMERFATRFGAKPVPISEGTPIEDTPATPTTPMRAAPIETPQHGPYNNDVPSC